MIVMSTDGGHLPPSVDIRQGSAVVNRRLEPNQTAWGSSVLIPVEYYAAVRLAQELIGESQRRRRILESAFPQLEYSEGRQIRPE
jgi:hypothetical protein